MKGQLLAAEPLAKPVRKPAGGYCLISVAQLAMAWTAYRERLIQFKDLRVWFSLREMLARRCTAGSERLPAYTLEELRGLVGGVGGEHLRASLGRLKLAGLASWGESKIEFACGPDAMPGDLSELWAMIAKIKNNRRRVPVPRRTIRLIAQTGRPVVVATILGHLLRCVYARGGGVVGEGACKASWVADVFGVGDRNVKAARQHLAAIGWLTVQETPQWYRQRYGGRAAVNLTWSRPDSYADPENESAPRTEFSTTESAPLSKQETLLLRSKNQKPTLAADRPAGVSIKQGGENPLAPPTLRNVQAVDLRETTRTLALYEQAASAGLIEHSHFGRLTFVSLAEHALVHGTVNPAGMLIWLLKTRNFTYITNDDEDAAQARLKRHVFGRDGQRESEKPKLVRVEIQLSDDARLVAAVLRLCRERRVDVDPLVLVKREKPEWTRERWERAIDEIERARFGRLVAREDDSENEGPV